MYCFSVFLVRNPCYQNRGNCSHFCLISSTTSTGYRCACPDGMMLINDTDCGRTYFRVIVYRTLQLVVVVVVVVVVLGGENLCGERERERETGGGGEGGRERGREGERDDGRGREGGGEREGEREGERVRGREGAIGRVYVYYTWIF